MIAFTFFFLLELKKKKKKIQDWFYSFFYPYMYLYGTTFHLSLLPLCIFIIVLDIYGWVVTLVIAKDNCSWAMRSNYLFVVTYLSIIFEFHPYTSYLDHECLFVDFSFFLYNYIALISPHHKIISPEGITSPERQKHRISQYT